MIGWDRDKDIILDYEKEKWVKGEKLNKIIQINRIFFPVNPILLTHIYVFMYLEFQ